jgi:uncharacterized protein
VSADPVVSVNEEAGRYEIHVEGAPEPAGFAEFLLDGDTITFTHTVIDDAYEGQGLGSRLARAALDDARSRGLRVVARCSFIAGWIEKHPDYADLLAA